MHSKSRSTKTSAELHLSYFRKDNQVLLAINEGESPHYVLDHTWRKNDSKNLQKTNGPVNAHLISGPSVSTQNLIKMIKQTLTLIMITHNPSFYYLVNYIS